jgi:hypothetical protein
VVVILILAFTLPSYPGSGPGSLEESILVAIGTYSTFMVWFFVHANRLYNELRHWNEDYIAQAYIINFDTTIPEGNTAAEKILNISKRIFPELTASYYKFSPYLGGHLRSYFKRKLGRSDEQQISKALNYMVNSYHLDLALKTIDGYFVVKYFGDKTVTVEDLKKLVQIVQGRFKDKYRRTFVLRTVCAAKNYDNSFLEVESLERQMTDLDANFSVDLLIEEKRGYSVLWVGRIK